MLRNATLVILFGCFALGLSSCGRTARSTIADDTTSTGPIGCEPSCEDLCTLPFTFCSTIAPSNCVDACNADPNNVLSLCLAQVSCSDFPSCNDLESCLISPVVPDLAISFSAEGAGDTITYTAKVCNQGSGTSVATTVDYYLGDSTPPTVGQRGSPSSPISALASGQCETVSATQSGMAQGNYTAYAQVDPVNSVVETNESNNVAGPQTIQLGVYVSDLVVESIKSWVDSDTFVRLSISVCNRGKANSKDTELDLYHDRPNAPGNAEPGNQRAVVFGLAAGACQNVDELTLKLSTATRLAWVYVDRANTVVESNEDNNVYGPERIEGYASNLAELVISKFDASGSFVEDEPLQYRVEVCNKGSVDARNFRIGIYYDRATAPVANTTANTNRSVSRLRPGQCTSRSRTTYLKAGTHTSWAFVDYRNDVPESNENNNASQPFKFSVQKPQGKADLEISTAKYAESGGTVTYVAEVCNIGSVASSASTLSLYADRNWAPSPWSNPTQTVSIAGIKANDCIAVTVTNTSGPGTFSSWLRVDRADQVNESNENNNVFGPLNVTVAQTGTPDLIIKAFTSNTTFGGMLQYTVEVCNQGQDWSSQSSVNLYYNQPSAPTVGSNGNYTASVTGLAPASCATVQAVAFLQAGSYTSWAYVDPSDQQAESNETNNVAGPLAVQVGGGDNTADCNTICSTIVSPCGYMTQGQIGACQSLCNAQPDATVACALAAAQSSDCVGIISCMGLP